MLLKLAVRVGQMSENLSQLMKYKSREVSLENFMKTIIEKKAEIMNMIGGLNQEMEQLSTDVSEYTI